MAESIACSGSTLWSCFGICLCVTVLLMLSEKVPYIKSPKKENVFVYHPMCQVYCVAGKPCEYQDEVDLRIMVITYDRAESMKKCLDSILKLDTMGDHISVEVWLDRDKKTGLTNTRAEHLAQEFVKEFSATGPNARGCVHRQLANANIAGQWIDTWRPKAGTKELGLILEDDVSIAPMAYRWLKNLHQHYGHQTETRIAGYTLQMENLNFVVGGFNPMKIPQDQMVFLYPVIGSWGYAPHPECWRDFQDWYAEVRPGRTIETDKIKPYVDGIQPTESYKYFEKRGKGNTIWTIWHIKYTAVKQAFTVYSNLKHYTGREDVLLSNNRQEKGLHFDGKSVNEQSHNLLNKWETKFEKLSKISDIPHLNYDGKNCSELCCFKTDCKKPSSNND